jgi:hypothetical protein
MEMHVHVTLEVTYVAWIKCKVSALASFAKSTLNTAGIAS